jgi:phosphatidylglycerophosphatase A
VLPKSIVIYGSFTILLFVVGVMLATRLEATWGRDARRITIDELVGTLVTFAGVPLSLGSALAGFVLFRFFDIVKLPAVRACERLPGGWGIVADDVAAGICANAVLQLVCRELAISLARWLPLRSSRSAMSS